MHKSSIKTIAAELCFLEFALELSVVFFRIYVILSQRGEQTMVHAPGK